ncbi:MAG: hypothetical protein PHW31_03335, partial [Candidatus Pacebacteria bacterium]|nr:hypothetical protein [Candidatus Paceibacterota bacterium]
NFAASTTFGADITVTGTTTLNGDITLGSASSDNIVITGTVASATTTLLSIGGGPIISHLYSTSTAIDFGIITASDCATSSTSLSGVLIGDPVVLGVPNEVAAATSTVSWNAWVVASGMVYVRVCNNGPAATPDFDPGTFRIDVWQH